MISSVCISKNGSMVWNYTDKAYLTMKDFSENELITYLNKISDEALYAYNVYQIEGEGRALFSKIDGDEDTIMGLPIKKIKEYLELQKKKFFVIGNPIEHSLSPKLHNYWIKSNNLKAVYDKKKLDISELENLIKEVKEKKLMELMLQFLLKIL